MIDQATLDLMQAAAEYLLDRGVRVIVDEGQPANGCCFESRSGEVIIGLKVEGRDDVDVFHTFAHEVGHPASGHSLAVVAEERVASFLQEPRPDSDPDEEWRFVREDEAEQFASLVEGMSAHKRGLKAKLEVLIR